MAAKKEVIAAPPLETYVVVKIGYDSVVLPLAAALALTECFSKAEAFHTTWENSTQLTHIGGPLPSFEMSLMTGADYAMGKMNGPKEK